MIGIDWVAFSEQTMYTLSYKEKMKLYILSDTVVDYNFRWIIEYIMVFFFSFLCNFTINYGQSEHR